MDNSPALLAVSYYYYYNADLKDILFKVRGNALPPQSL